MSSISSWTISIILLFHCCWLRINWFNCCWRFMSMFICCCCSFTSSFMWPCLSVKFFVWSWMNPGRSFLPSDLAGSSRKNAGKSPDPSGKHWKLLESTEKIRKLPDRNTASNFLVFFAASRPFPVVRRSSGKWMSQKCTNRYRWII